ncbi:MAG: family 16 glycosylhydrolase [Spirochaetota bacterium]
MEGFHTYSVWWTPTEYIFYTDNVETWRTNAGGICQVPLYIILSDEVMKNGWCGDIEKAVLPDTMFIDYVRVYDLTAQRAPSSDARH